MIKPAKPIPNKWLDTIILGDSVKGISSTLISKYDLLFRYLEDNK